MEHMTPHTLFESHSHFHLPLYVSSPSACWDQLTFSPGSLFQGKSQRHTINNLSANQTLHSIYDSYWFLPGGAF